MAPSDKAERLRELARDLRRMGPEARELLAGTTRWHDAQTWQGPVADNFSGQLSTWQGRLSDAEGFLLDAARDYERTADKLDEGAED